MKRAESIQHSAAASAMAHRIRAQLSAGGSFDCLVPRASTFSAPSVHGRLADFLPYANHHWEEAHGLSVVWV